MSSWHSFRKLVRADLAAYYPFAWMYERAWWAVLTYRVGHEVQYRFGARTERLWPPVRFLIKSTGLAALRIVEAFTGAEIPPGTQIGPGLRVWHGGNLVINPRSSIGANCLIRHGVTIGNLDP